MDLDVVLYDVHKKSTRVTIRLTIGSDATRRDTTRRAKEATSIEWTEWTDRTNERTTRRFPRDHAERKRRFVFVVVGVVATSGVVRLNYLGGI